MKRKDRKNDTDRGREGGETQIHIHTDTETEKERKILKLLQDVEQSIQF